MAKKKAEKKVTVETITKELAPVVKVVDALTIKNESDKELAGNKLAEMKAMLKRIETEKERVTKPLNEALKSERSRWKPAETQLENGIQLLTKELTRYQTEETRKAQEKEQNIAKRVGEGRGKLSTEKAAEQIDNIDKPKASMSTSTGGTMKFREVKNFEVIDVSKLPAEYVVPASADTAKIRASMNAGIELPGVRYFTEQKPVNR